MNRYLHLLVPPLIIALILSFNIPYVYPIESQVLITIGEDGVARVSLNASIYVGLNKIYLPVPPSPETIDVTVDGKTIPPIYFNNSIVIPSDFNGTAHITYIANVSVIGGKIIVEVGNARVMLKASKNIVLLNLPENVTKIETEDGTLILGFTGPAKIMYTVGTIKRPGGQPGGGGVGGIIIPPGLQWWIIPLIIGIVIVVAILFSRRRAYEGLDETDRMILEYLEGKGGSALQSEIMGNLKIPKTTLWRHVKRLEDYGYVTVERVGRVNIVKLKK